MRRLLGRVHDSEGKDPIKFDDAFAAFPRCVPKRDAGRRKSPKTERLAPLARDADGIVCNVNADDAAAGIAASDSQGGQAVDATQAALADVGGLRFNVAAFQILSALAQLSGDTSRAIIVTYSMPIWATLLSVLILRERLDRARLAAFVLCVAGISVLVWPLFANDVGPPRLDRAAIGECGRLIAPR